MCYTVLLNTVVNLTAVIGKAKGIMSEGAMTKRSFTLHYKLDILEGEINTLPYPEWEQAAKECIARSVCKQRGWNKGDFLAQANIVWT